MGKKRKRKGRKKPAGFRINKREFRVTVVSPSRIKEFDGTTIV